MNGSRSLNRDSSAMERMVPSPVKSVIEEAEKDPMLRSQSGSVNAPLNAVSDMTENVMVWVALLQAREQRSPSRGAAPRADDARLLQALIVLRSASDRLITDLQRAVSEDEGSGHSPGRWLPATRNMTWGPNSSKKVARNGRSSLGRASAGRRELDAWLNAAEREARRSGSHSDTSNASSANEADLRSDLLKDLGNEISSNAGLGDVRQMFDLTGLRLTGLNGYSSDAGSGTGSPSTEGSPRAVPSGFSPEELRASLAGLQFTSSDGGLDSLNALAASLDTGTLFGELDQVNDLKAQLAGLGSLGDLPSLEKREAEESEEESEESEESEEVDEEESEEAEDAETPRVRLFRDYGTTESINSAGLRRAGKKAVHVGKMRGKKTKPQMEDAHFFVDAVGGDAAIAAVGVLDGHVGAMAAFRARDVFPGRLAEAVAAHPPGEDAAAALRSAFAAVDEDLKEFEFEGCTGTVALVWEHEGRRYVQTGNVGDSTAFVQRGAEAVMLSRDHKVSDPEERARLEAMGITVNAGQTRINGLAVSRSLGDHFVKDQGLGLSGVPYISDVLPVADDTGRMVVASDGLWDVMTGKEAMDLCEDHDTAHAQASHLISTALRHPKCNDNITVSVMLL